MQLRKVLFKEAVDYSQFERFARSLSWSMVEEHPGDEETPEHISWLTPDGTTVMILFDDVLNLSYVSVVGDNATAAETALRQHFSSFDWAEAATRFGEATSADEKIRSLSVLAVTAPQEFEELPYNAIRTALEDDEPGVRSAAVVATIYARWAEFMPYLERVAADPANGPEVRETAEAVIETIRG